MNYKLCLGLFCLASTFALSACDDAASSDVSDLVGKPCDTKTFKWTCADDAILHCGQDGKTTLGKCGDKTCVEFLNSTTSTCDEDDEDCQDSSIDSASCIEKSEQCSKEGDIQNRCEKSTSGSTYNREYTCEKTKDGRMFYHRTNNSQCYDGYGVCSEDNKCLEPEKCSTNGKHCDGNILVTCNANRLKTADCSAYSPARTCTTIDETSRCMSDKDICTEEGEEIVTSCNAKTNKEYIKVCTRAENGKLYYISDGNRACTDGCNEDNTACAQAACSDLNSTIDKCRIQGTATSYIDTYTCIEDAQGKKALKLTSTEKCDGGSGTCSDSGECIPAETCESKSFEPRCEGTVALTCSSKKVKRYYCDLYSSPHHCVVVDEKARCLEEADECTDEGELIITRCNTSTNKISLSTCMAGSDGKFYYISSGTRACPNGCNAEGTDCAD